MDRIDEFLAKLGIVEYNIAKKCVYMSCPVHGGNNEVGCKIFLNETLKYPVNWKCFTNQCERDYGKGFVGFVAGVLKISKKDAKKWVEEFTGSSITHYINSERLIDQVLGMKREESQLALDRDYVLSTLDLAPKFYLDKNFKKETLLKYDVGISKQQGATYYNKIVVPVYDDNREKVVGFTMRTQNPKCKKCNLFHTEGMCPQTFQEKNQCNKWMNSGFNKTNYLYNYWFAKQMIKKHGSVIIVEGPADVWRIAESGIENVVAMLGVELSDGQRLILEKCGVRNIIAFTDPDEAGEQAIAKIKELCGHMYNIIPIKHDKEPADLTSEQNLDILLPILKRIK